MKRIFALLLALLLCSALTIPALADVIWEPEGDFFAEHADECDYEGRAYLAAGEEGFVRAFDNPLGELVAEFPNGEEFWIEWIWDREGGWGFFTYRDELHGWQEAWAPLGDLTLKYDAISFAEEHGAEFIHPEEGELLPLEGRKQLVIWLYPGAEDYTLFPLEGWDDPEPILFDTLYEDPEGRTWGNVGYYYGSRNVWVCLSDPESEDLGGTVPVETPAPTEAPAPAEAPEPTEAPASATGGVPASTPAPTAVPAQKSGGFPWLPAALVAAVVIVAAVLLAVFRRKNS